MTLPPNQLDGRFYAASAQDQLEAVAQSQSSKPWPRRRDVRDMLLSISNLLADKGYIEVDGEIVTGAEAEEEHDTETFPHVDFDRDFLTEVRDLMRDGASLSDALMAIGNAQEVEAEEYLDGPAEGHVDETGRYVSADFVPPSPAELFPIASHRVEELQQELSEANRGMIREAAYHPFYPFLRY